MECKKQQNSSNLSELKHGFKTNHIKELIWSGLQDTQKGLCAWQTHILLQKQCQLHSLLGLHMLLYRICHTCITNEKIHVRRLKDCSLWCFQSDHMLGYHLHLLLWVLLTTISTTIQLLEIHKGMHKVLKTISWCTQDFFQMLGKHQTYGNLKSGQKTATNNSETV
jgi:hypothetical protein